MLLFLNCGLSILFLFFKNPLSKGYMLLMLTISTSLLASMMYLNSWFGYILFLIMVGGMLVAFIYMTSTAPNEKFGYPNLLMLMLFLMTMIVTFYMIYKTETWSNHGLMSSSQELIKSSMPSLSKLFFKPLNYIPLALMSYLLLTLIMVVKMTEFIKGPIRQK
uniref:NADH-ubiquinone oxidoreductase chain 6 n=1 Tax=Xyleborinus saxesenii TaxID=1230758 RepID=A0A343A5F4_9CUCU|nr:NADH dehydrogenase subunit 6 [Xyleborinus saxesenii]